MTRLPTFVACAPGLEALLAQEITALAADAEPVTTAGGVELIADTALLYRLHLELGLALKILVRVGEFDAARFRQLEQGTAAVAWEHWCRPFTPVRVRALCRHSRLWHSDAVAERVQSAIAARLESVADRAGSRRERRRGDRNPATPDDPPPELEVHVRLVDDVCTLSIDTGGDTLSRRGYREATAKAPLREDLARALVIVSGWDRTSPLIDPFAGSGTIAIEADWLARRVPPGAMRRFALFDMPGFDAALWESLKRAALERVVAEGPEIFASDRDAGAVRSARANAERAGCTRLHIDEAALTAAPAFATPPAEHGAVVTNPPWGHRVRGRDPLANLYAAFGNSVRALPGRWRVAMAAASVPLARSTGLDLAPALMTDHGGIKVYFAVGDSRAKRQKPRQRGRRRRKR